MPKDLTQEKFARLVGITQPAVSQLIRKGVLTRGADVGTWLQEYLKNLREQAAQHKSEAGLDRVHEAALLDRRKREEIELRIAEKTGHLLSDDVFVEGVSTTFTSVKSGLLGIPNKFKSQCPHIALEDLQVLKDIIRDVCSEFSSDRFPTSVRARLEKSLGDNGASAKINRKRMGRRKAKAQLGEQP